MVVFRSLLWLLTGLAAGIGLITGSPAQAQNSLLVIPTRVIVDRGGSTEVFLKNNGQQVSTFRISTAVRRMLESGEFVDVAPEDATPAERAALNMVRFAPRRVTLEPGQLQTVRLAMRPPEGLPDGEYRVQLKFETLAGPDPALTESQSGHPAQPAIRVQPLYGIGIPVFLRKGALKAESGISAAKLRLENKKSILDVVLTRLGTRSVYGDLTVKTTTGAEIATLSGIAVYPEVARRSVRIDLTAQQAAQITGPLAFEYREPTDQGGALIARATINPL